MELLVEGDAQLERPNSQTCLEQCRAWATYIFGVSHKHNSLPLGPIHPSSPATKELHASGRFLR